MNTHTVNIDVPCEYPTQFVGEETPPAIKVTVGGSFYAANPRSEKKITSYKHSINDSPVNIRTTTSAVYIDGASCHSCCDECEDCDDDDRECVKTSKYARHTLSSVFNKLEELNQLPDPSKILDLWYINRNAKEELQGEEKNDAWWFNYLIQNYKMVQFVSCNMFDEERVYGLYTRKGLL